MMGVFFLVVWDRVCIFCVAFLFLGLLFFLCLVSCF